MHIYIYYAALSRGHVDLQYLIGIRSFTVLLVGCILGRYTTYILRQHGCHPAPAGLQLHKGNHKPSNGA